MPICLKVATQNNFNNVFSEVDLDSSTRVTISYAVVDFLNLNKPQSFKSTEIVIAGTARSNKVLKSAFRVDTIDSSVQGLELDCRLEYNGLDILRGSGKITINSVEYNSETGYHSYDCYLVGTRYNWVKPMIDTKVCDLETLPTFTIDDTLIKNSWDRFGVNGTVYNHEYIGATLTPVHYGSWNDPSPGPDKSIYSEDIFPSPYIYTLVQAIFSELTDFDLRSEFFETEFFKGLTIPFTTKSGVLTRELRDAATIRVINEGNPTVSSSVGANIIKFPFFDYNFQEYKFDIWDGFRYKVKYGVKYRVELDLKFFAGAGHTGTPDFRVFQDPTPNCSTPVDLSYDVSLSDPVTIVPGSNGSAKLVWETCLCPDKDNFTAGVKVLFTSGTPDFTVLETSRLLITPISTTGLNCNFPVQLSDYSPCVSCKELLDALTQMFSLVWDTNESTKTIYVEPDSLFYYKSVHNDLSEKVNNSRPISKRIKDIEDSQNIEFKYKKDENDFWLKVQEEVEGSSPFSSTLLTSDTNSSSKKTYENPVFSASTYIADTDVMGSASYPPHWIRMWKEVTTSTNPSYDFNFRIAYFGGIQEYGGAGFLYEGVQQVGFPHMWFVNGYDGSNYSLAFNNANESSAFNDTGLVEIYWDRFKDASRIGVTVQLEAFLSERDIFSWGFRNLIYIQHPILGDGHYRLNSIREWDAEEGRALLELVLVSN